eukprot:7927221-Lingulodinium_polyedra.AAC.1
MASASPSCCGTATKSLSALKVSSLRGALAPPRRACFAARTSQVSSLAAARTKPTSGASCCGHPAA